MEGYIIRQNIDKKMRKVMNRLQLTKVNTNAHTHCTLKCPYTKTKHVLDGQCVEIFLYLFKHKKKLKKKLKPFTLFGALHVFASAVRLGPV